MMKKKVVVLMKSGAINEVFSSDESVSITFIDLDVRKECQGMSTKEVEKLIATETNGLKKVLQFNED